MAKTATTASSLCFHLFMLAILCLHSTEATLPVPAIFIFGDSTFDVGTNNFLKDSQATANFPYNGIDFPYSVPTGRFSNGYNSADQIGTSEVIFMQFTFLLIRAFFSQKKIMQVFLILDHLGQLTINVSPSF